MLKALRNDAKRQSLNARDGFVAVLAVAHDAFQRGYFGQPTAIILAFEFDRERHASYCTIRPAVSQGAAPVGAAPAFG